VLAACVAFALGAPAPSKAQKPGEVYLPVAKAAIDVIGEAAEPLLNDVARFAIEQDATIKRGDFPKQGRRVVNLTIVFKDDTFFTLDNFVSSEQFYLTAYSHDDERIWSARWDRLVSSLRARLGNEHINRR
jgi:hypothetical protein